MNEQIKFSCRICAKAADLFDFGTQSYFCDDCSRIDAAVHTKFNKTDSRQIRSEPECWICRRAARIYDLHYERMYCQNCIDSKLGEELERGFRRSELIAFENSFECPFCHSRENDPAFTPSDSDLMFAGWRVCRSCGRRYSQTDADFLKVAKIEFYSPDVCAGSSEEE
jgi:hypothetical protein